MAKDWLRRHLDAVAAVITVAAFGVRVYVSSRYFLNPDEALHYLIANQPNLWLTYKASLTNAHPPLIYLILHVWQFFGRSELTLRMPSILAGTAACWFGHKWTRIVAGDTAGMAGLLFLAFSPAAVILSSEVRAYAVLLGCMTAALYFLARAFEKESAVDMCSFSACLYLAILSHYSAIFFTLAAGLYAVARLTDLKRPRHLVAAWGAGQAGALTLYGFLYVTHVSKIKGSIAVWGSSFGTAYFNPTDGNLIGFTSANTLHIFQFLFGQNFAAWALLVSFLTGVAILFRKDLLPGSKSSRTSHLGILLLVPFLAVWGAALVRAYPYVGSRHTVFLVPFAIAGASFLVATISREKISVALVCAAFLVGISQTGSKSMELNISGGDNSRQQMTDAIQYMEKTIPRGDHILVDFQSSLPIIYYFCGPKMTVPMKVFDGWYFDFNCNGDPIVSLHSWKAAALGFSTQFVEVAQANGLRPGDRVWFYQTGWGELLDANLDRKKPQFRCMAPRHFGGGVVVIPFVVGPDFQPAAPSSSCPS